MEEKETNSEQTKKRSGVSRRQFIAGTVGGVVVGGLVGAAAGSLGFPKTITQTLTQTRTQTATQTQTQTATQTTTATTTATPWLPAKWDYSADVVVVGYGSAGAVAAITAYDAGAKVLVVERTPSLASLGIQNTGSHETSISGGGGNSHICGGAALGVTDPTNGAIYQNAMSFGSTSMAVSQAWANMSAQNKAWLDAMGIPYTLGTTAGEYPNFPGAAKAGLEFFTVPDDGMGLFYYLDQLVVSKRSISVLFNTRGSALIQNPTTREVLGVQAQQGQGGSADQSTIVNIQAKRGVILTTGGFEFDSVMKLNYLKMAPYHFGGWQYNTGDGIKMALKAGAGLWHMNSTSGRLSPWIPTYNMAWAQAHATNAYVWVDRYGNRFANETALPSHSAWQAVVDWNFQYGEYSRVPTMLIFDATGFAGVAAGGEEPKTEPVSVSPQQVTTTTTTTSQLSTITGASSTILGTGIQAVSVQLGGVGQLGFTGSAVGTPWDNNAMLQAGYIIQGPDIPTLAANIASATIPGSNQGMTVPAGWNSAQCMDAVALPGGTSCPHMSAANLSAAVAKFNADYAASKGDTVFGRAQGTMAPIQKPPYYAMALWPAGPNTNGGPIRNEKSQVCDPDYNPIPRLYSGGELGSVWGFLYEGRGNIGESIAFGRIGGTNAAAETPWTT